MNVFGYFIIITVCSVDITTCVCFLCLDGFHFGINAGICYDIGYQLHGRVDPQVFEVRSFSLYGYA